MEECPICFLSYGAVNITTCCGAIICTECFLQVRPQKEKDSTCPFCSSEKFSVTIAKKKNINSFSLVPGTLPSSSSLTTTSLSTTSSSTLGSNTGNINSSITVNNKKKTTASVAPNTPPAKACRFGSELEKDESFKKFKKRSESFASTEGSSTPKKDKEIIESIAMTTEERQRLEEEMKAQHYHPLVLKIEAEAQERRMQNDRAYRYRRSTGGNIEAASNRRLRLRGGSARNWDQLANFLEGEEINDMTALEQVIMLHSIGEGERGSGGNDNSSNGNINSNDDDDDSNNSNLEQQEGFPLFRSLLTGQLDINDGRAVGSSTAAGRSWTRNWQQRHPFMGSNIGASLNVSLNTASLMGLSEEEQISMAIAASMRDQEQQSARNDSDDTNEDENVNNAITDEESSDAGDDNDNSNTISTADDAALGVSAGLVAVTDSTPRSQQFKNEGNGDEASTITELARVVTDSRAPSVDTCGIAA